MAASSRKRPHKEDLEAGEVKPSAAKKAKTAIRLEDNFRQGDLLFGLSGPKYPRDKITDQLETNGFKNTYANTLNDGIVEAVLKRKIDHTSTENPQLKHFFFLLGHRDYLLRQPGKKAPFIVDEQLGAAYRRACKLLLINRDSKRTSRTHIITTGIRWAEICDKSKAKLSITCSELRAAFRDYLKHGKNPHILFYNDKLEVMDHAPWEEKEIKPFFDAYAKSVKEKHAKKQNQNQPEAKTSLTVKKP